MVLGAATDKPTLIPQPDTQLQERIYPDNQKQRTEEKYHARKAVEKSLPGLVTEMVGDQRQHDHANDVCGKGDGHDQDRESDVAQDRVVSHYVEVEQAQRFQREKCMQARRMHLQPGAYTARFAG